MSLQFELPRSNRFSFLLLGAVMLTLLLWPVVERTIDRLVPGAAPREAEKSGASGWDLRAM